MMQERNKLSEKAPIRKSGTKIDIVPSEKLKLSKERQEYLNSMLLEGAFNGNNACYGTVAEMRRFIREGADIAAKAKNEKNRTPLHHAALNGHNQICTLLIKEYAKRGGDIKELIIAKDDEGWTPLHRTAWNGHSETCALLIHEYAKAGGDAKKLIASTDNNNQTALYWAASNDNPKTCALILYEYIKAGGDIKELIIAKNDEGKTAQDWASQKQCTQTKKFLRSMGWLADITENAFIKPFGECISGGV
ncbi:MAG: ankyrin repeat domain-containing protein [Candidatus Micrarchaeota archaeon]|nr:ankyrin repeat domain-containing protein [Candidatus Micrarchaeota archaeon]